LTSFAQPDPGHGPDHSPESPGREQQLELGEDDNAIALRKAWERTLRALPATMVKQTIDNWLRPLRPLSYDDGVVVLGAPSSFAKTYIETKYAPLLREFLAQYLDAPHVQVRFVISTPDVQPLLGEKPLPLRQAARHDVPVPGAPALPAAGETLPRASRDMSPAVDSNLSRNPFAMELAAAPLIDRYTFEHFVEGKSNRIAYNVALNVADAPGTLYNPLFLYGNPGLGKTHLMHAIGNRMRESMPGARIAYVSGETFTNHYVAAIRDKRTEDFRRAYRSVDIWLIDDIQTIASKEQTKEEFFHTFNTLYQMNRQIVITSDRSPRELRTMDDRLKSRFEAGLVTDIAPPELEMREAILQKKALQENLPIPPEVIAYMANLIQSNIRALEGALVKLMAYASLARSPITKQLASDVLSGYFVERIVRPDTPGSAHPQDYAQNNAPPALMSAAGPNVNQIIDTVAAQTGVSREMILAGGGRSNRAGGLRGDPAFARQAAMYLAKDMTNVPVTILAATFGCKNRTAVTHAATRLQGMLQTDPEVLNLISNIRKVIQYNM